MGLGRTHWRLQPKHWIAISVAVLILAFGGFLGLRYAWLLRCEQLTRENTHWLQWAIENWKKDRGMMGYQTEYPAIPTDLNSYLQSVNLTEIPTNPFSGKPVKLIEWGESPEPGDITFLLAKEYFLYSDKPDRQSDTSYQLLSYSVRSASRVWFLDGDENGYADPVILYLTGGSTHGSGYHDGTEGLTDTLVRYDYTRDLESSLPFDTLPFWRWMFFLDPMG